MAQDNSVQGSIAEWRRLHTAIVAHEGALPALGPYRAALEAALEEVCRSKTEQINLRAKLKQATRDVHDNLAAGREWVYRLKCFVQVVFGRDDERLADFGIPLPRRRNRRAPPEPGRQEGSPGVH
jgi:hypothetical protein